MLEATIKQTEPMTVAYIAMRGAYSQVGEGYGSLYGWIAQHGLQAIGMPQAVYFTSPADTPESEALFELWAPVASAEELAPDASEVGIKHIPSTTVASTMFTGPYDAMYPTYELLGAWIEGQGYRIAGPPSEIYYSDPEEVPPEQYVTEIVFPVAKR